MNNLPPKLFEMSKLGVAESVIQYIFDAMIEAENRDVRFLNVYDYEAPEPAFLFTNDAHQAADQFARFRKIGRPALAFVNTGEAREERQAESCPQSTST